MFDSEPGELDAAATMSLVSSAHRLVTEQECHLLELAAHWADLHHPASQSVAERALPGAERAWMLGGEGTPEVLEFAVAELGARMGRRPDRRGRSWPTRWICDIGCRSCGS